MNRMRLHDLVKENMVDSEKTLSESTAPDTARSRAWIEINLDALRHNIRYLQSLLPESCALMPVIKANAYGHGADLIARELTSLDIRSFCVACVSEGVELRRRHIAGEILVLGYTHPDQFPLLDQYALTQTVTDHSHALELNAYACSASRCRQPARTSSSFCPDIGANTPHSTDRQKPAIYSLPPDPSKKALFSPAALPVHIAVDTGMHRLGEPAEHVAQIREILSLPGLQVTGMYSHLAAAGGTDTASRNFTREQINTFYQLAAQLNICSDAHDIPLRPQKSQNAMPLCETAHLPAAPTTDSPTPEASHSHIKLHLQASYGILRYPLPNVDCARPGIALYGLLSNAADTQTLAGKLRPVLSLRARVAAIHRLSPGESAGYDMAYTATRPTTIATITIGYADGLPRSLSDSGATVLLHGQHAPIIGKICMDQLLADVTGIPNIRPGDIATLIGQDGQKGISAADLADACGTITNELLSCLGPRLERLAL